MHGLKIVGAAIMSVALTVAVSSATLAQTVTAAVPPPPEQGPPAAKRPAPDKKKTSKVVPAKKLFGAKSRAAKLAARSIGFYSRGCLSGAKYLPVDGPAWQAMRLSRNRNWGHPVLIKYIERLAKDAKAAGEWPGLLVGDLTQPRGGPMTSGHASHQVGLDADIWLTPMPANHRYTWQERETVAATTMLKNILSVNPKVFTPNVVALIKRAAEYDEVERIGVNPAIKYALCKAAGGDKPWLGKIQSWPGHHYHMHIRLKCPPGSGSCRHQGKPGRTSCAVSERWYKDTKAWLEHPKPAPKHKKTRKHKPKPPITLDGLPAACREVLAAAPTGGPKLLTDVAVPERKPGRAPEQMTAGITVPKPQPASRLRQFSPGGRQISGNQ